MKERLTTSPGLHCFFIQGTFGNIIMRLRDPVNGPGVTLTLHQIVALQIPVKTIPFFDSDEFCGFYGLGTIGREVYNNLTTHNEEDVRFLESLV